MSESIALDCPAKINFFLEVHGRRPDGFHEIETVLQTIGLYDTLHIRTAPTGVETIVSGADLPTDERNLATLAAVRFLEKYAPDRGARIRLQKRIPMMAGLGGGSSDAAGVLLALRELLSPDLSNDDLAPLAAELGSDVPFFFTGGTAVATGRGERITPVRSVPPTWLVLCRPQFGLSTPAVYGAVRVPGEHDRRSAADLLAAESLGGHLFNRLEAAAARIEPRILDLPETLPGEGWMMTGSGSAFFSIASSLHDASERAAAINAGDGAGAWAVRTIE